jgi:hypothetical protein
VEAAARARAERENFIVMSGGTTRRRCKERLVKKLIND